MELPHLGTHCSIASCNRLDYLPVKCDYCKFTFCSDHGYSPDRHSCSAKHLIKEVVVDVCPKCKIRVKKDEKHECKTTKRKRKCIISGCRSKVLIPLKCSQCFQQVCPAHRFPTDHDCPSLRPTSNNLIKACA